MSCLISASPAIITWIIGLSTFYVYVFYDECSEDVRLEYSSAKYRLRNWGSALGAIAPPLKKNFSREYQNEIIYLVLLPFHFWSVIEKYYYLFISTGWQNNSYQIIQRKPLFNRDLMCGSCVSSISSLKAATGCVLKTVS